MEENEVVLARYTWLHAVFLFIATGIGLLSLWYWWAAASTTNIAYAGVFAGASGMGALYFAWRTVKIARAKMFRGSASLFIRTGMLHGAGSEPIALRDIESVELKVNEAGRAVLHLRVRGHGVVKTAVSWMDPEPAEISERLSKRLMEG